MIVTLSSLFYILFPPIIIILSDYHNKIPECVIYKQQKLAHYREVQWRIKTTASSVCHETLSIDEAFSLPSYCRSLIPFRGAPSSWTGHLIIAPLLNINALEDWIWTHETGREITCRVECTPLSKHLLLHVQMFLFSIISPTSRIMRPILTFPFSLCARFNPWPTEIVNIFRALTWHQLYRGHL